eukprot:8744626-Prorocentrum_lima.AAC.1
MRCQRMRLCRLEWFYASRQVLLGNLQRCVSVIPCNGQMSLKDIVTYSAVTQSTVIQAPPGTASG